MKKILIAAVAATLMALPMTASADTGFNKSNGFEVVAEKNPVFSNMPNIGRGGKDGKDGRDGVDGIDGKDGVDGRDGVDGVAGADGVDGKDGVDGVAGTDGVDGKDGADGVAGRDGVDGKDGRDGLNAVLDSSRYMNDLAATTALGGLELRDTYEGEWSLAAGIGGNMSDGSGAEAISIGVSYGVTNSSSLYGKVSHSLRGDSTAWFIGFNAMLN
jgi:hypothetical protein